MKDDELSDCIEISAGGIYVDMRVSPGSRRTTITGINPWRNQLEISVVERAEDGKANRALKDYFSETFDIPSSGVRIAKGRTDKNKRLYLSGLSEGEFMKRVMEMMECGE